MTGAEDEFKTTRTSQLVLAASTTATACLLQSFLRISNSLLVRLPLLGLALLFGLVFATSPCRPVRKAAQTDKQGY